MYRKLLVLLMVTSLLLGACAQEQAAPEPTEVVPTDAPEEEVAEETTTEEEVEVTQEPTEVPWVDVTLGFGGSPTNAHPGVYIGQVMGFWEEEHLDYEVQWNDGSTQSLQLLEAGQLDFAQMTPETVVNAVAKGIDVIAVYTVNKFSSKACVAPDSEIESMADMKGKKFGIPSATSGQVFFARAMLEEAGLDPENDVEWVPTGFGPSGAELLMNGDVAAVAYWGGWYIQAEELGYEFRCFELPGMEKSPGHVIATTTETVKNNPELIARFGRAYAKSNVYADSHAEGTAIGWWELYPETKKPDVPEGEQLASNASVIAKSVDETIFDYEGWQRGHNNPDGWAALVDFMVETGQLDEPVSVENLFTNQFVDQYNDFDAEKIEAMPAPDLE